MSRTNLQMPKDDGGDDGSQPDEEVFVLQTALFQAIVEGKRTVVDDLLSEYPLDLNLRNVYGELALQVACGQGDLTLVRSLLDHGAKLNLGDNHGESAMHWAARQGHGEIVRLLYERGSMVDTQNKSGETSVHVAARHTYDATVRQLCRCGADVNVQDEHGETALHIAAWHGFSAVLHVLGEVGAHLDTRNHEFETAIHCAAARGHFRCVRQLLRLGADPNVPDKNGCTALHLALRRRHVRIALLLLRHRAVRLDLVDLHGDSVLHIACRQRLRSVVHVLCAKLTESTANHHLLVDRRNRIGDTPLHVSVSSGQVELVRTLLAAGADIQCCDSNQQTPLMVAETLHDNAFKAKQSERECAHAANILKLLQITSSHKKRCSLLSALRPSGAIRSISSVSTISTVVHQCPECEAPLIQPKSGCCNSLTGVCVAPERNSCCNRLPNWWSYWLPSLLKSVALSSPSLSNECLVSSTPTPNLPVSLKKCRLVVLGHSGVGKSTLLDTLCCGYFSSFWRKPRLKSSQSAVNTTNSLSSTNVSAAASCVSLVSNGTAAEPTRSDAMPACGGGDDSLMDGLWPLTGISTSSCCTVNACQSNELARDPLLACSQSCVQVRPMHVSSVGDLVVWSFGAACTDFTLADRLLDYDSLHLLLLRAHDPPETQAAQAQFWLRLLINVLPVQAPLNRLGQTARPVRIQIVYTHLDQLSSHNSASSNLISQCQQLRTQYEHLLSIAPTPILVDATASGSCGIKQLKQLLCEEKENRLRQLGPICPLLESCAKHVQHLRSPPGGSALTTRPQLIQSFQQTLNPLASVWQLRAICRQLRLLAELHPLRNPRIEGVNLVLLDPVWFANRVLESLFKHRLPAEELNDQIEILTSDHIELLPTSEMDEPKKFADRQNSGSPSICASSTHNLGTSLRLSLDQLQLLQPQTDALDLLLLLQNLELCSSSEGDFEYLFPARFTSGSLIHTSYSSSRRCLSSSCCLSTSGYLSNSAASVASVPSPSNTIANDDVQLTILLKPSTVSANSNSPSITLLFGRLQVLLERANQAATLLPGYEQVQLMHHPGQVRIYLFESCILLRLGRDPLHGDPALHVHLSASEHSMAGRAFRTFELLVCCVQALVNNIWPGQYLTRHYVSVAQLRRGDTRPHSYSSEQINRRLWATALQNESIEQLLRQTIVAPDGTEDHLDTLLLAGTKITPSFVNPPQGLLGFELRLEEQLVRLQKLNWRAQMKRNQPHLHVEPEDEEDDTSDDENSETRSDTANSEYVELWEDDEFSDEDDEPYVNDRDADRPESSNFKVAGHVHRWLTELCNGNRPETTIVQFGLLRPVLSIQTHVCDLPLAVLQAFCALFDRPHEFGLDWCLLGVQLQMTDKLPLLDGTNRTTSSTWRLLQECRNRVDFSVALLCNILQQIGRNDALQLLLEATPPLQLLPVHSNTLKLIVPTTRDQND